MLEIIFRPQGIAPASIYSHRLIDYGLAENKFSFYNFSHEDYKSFVVKRTIYISIYITHSYNLKMRKLIYNY